MNAKIKALLNAVDAGPEDADVTVDGDTYSYGPGEYLVLTDDEANAKTTYAILDSLWAFNASFISDHAHQQLDDRAIVALQKMQNDLCESANPLVRALIKNIGRFVQDAIRADGRGHFLASYDHEEIEARVDGETYFVYRVN